MSKAHLVDFKKSRLTDAFKNLVIIFSFIKACVPVTDWSTVDRFMLQ